MNFIQTLPHARFLSSRNDAILRICKDKTVLHLGFVDEGLLEDRLREKSWLHAKIADIAKKLVGVDISEDGVRQAREHGYDDCYIGNVEELGRSDFPRLNYDIVLAADIIEHVANPGRFLGELRELVADRTAVVFTTPNALSFKTLYFPLVGREAVHPDHNFYYSPTTIATLLGKYGFQVSDIGLYSSIWTRNKLKPQGCGERMAKLAFTGVDTVLRYSLIPLFPYFSEGMLVQARRQR